MNNDNNLEIQDTGAEIIELIHGKSQIQVYTDENCEEFIDFKIFLKNEMIILSFSRKSLPSPDTAILRVRNFSILVSDLFCKRNLVETFNLLLTAPQLTSGQGGELEKLYLAASIKASKEVRQLLLT